MKGDNDAEGSFDSADPSFGYSPGSVDNALRVMQMFRETKLLRVAQVGRRLGVARSTAHRLLQVMQSHGFVEQDTATRGYRVGPELLALSVILTRGLDLRTVARPIMIELVEELDETVLLSVLRGSDILFIESFESSRALRVGARTGLTRPAYATAAGRVMLAALETYEVRKLYPDDDLSHLTQHTLATRDALEEVLEVVRRDGYAVSIQETESEISSVATPVRDGTGHVVGALAIAAPPSRIDLDEVPNIAQRLRAAADRIGSLLPA